MIRLIDALLEGFDADTAHSVDESLVLVLTLLEIDIEQLGDRIGHASFGTEGPITSPAPRERPMNADGDLVPLLAVLIDTEYPMWRYGGGRRRSCSPKS